MYMNMPHFVKCQYLHDKLHIVFACVLCVFCMFREFRKVNGTMTPEEIQADLEERLARRRKEREERIRAMYA